MCNPTDIQHKIHKRTGAGDMIAKFLVETLQGQHTDAKFNHRLDAAKHLMKYGFSEANPVRPELVEGPVEGHEATALSTRHSRAGGNPEAQGDDETPVQSPLSPGERARVRGTEIATPISHLDILNYEIAHLIRHETAEGHTLVEFLIHTMTGRDRPFTPKKFCIKPADRMAAARELLRRGFGDLGSRRRQSDTTDEANAYDTLHTDLAKRMREYSERGTDTVRFLLEVMSDPNPEEEYTIHHRMSAAQELLRRGWDTNYDNIKPKHLQDYWRDKESPRLSIGQKKTHAGLSTSIDDYDNYDDTDYEAIAKEMMEEEDRDVNSKPLRFQETVPSSCHSSESRNLEDRQAASKSRHSRAGGNPEGQGEAPNNPPLPQGEGWGEGTAGILNKPLPPRLGKSLPPAKAGVRMGVKSPEQSPLPNKAATVNEQDKAIIKEFREAMDKGDERAALRAKAKYRRIDVKPKKNIYDYGPNDPDPTIDYYFEPLNPEEQAKFDQEDRREHGLTEEEIADYSNMPAPRGMSDPLVQLAEAAEAHNTPILPNPLAGKRKNPTIRSP